MQLPKIKKPSFDRIANNVIASSRLEGISFSKSEIKEIKEKVKKDLFSSSNKPKPRKKS